MFLYCAPNIFIFCVYSDLSYNFLAGSFPTWVNNENLELYVLAVKHAVLLTLYLTRNSLSLLSPLEESNKYAFAYKILLSGFSLTK